MTTTSQARYSLAELAALAGVTPRTVRYYISQGLLPSAAASGPGAKYGDAHLGRLRLIRKLQQNHQPLATIRQQLERLGDARIAELERSPAPAASADSALDYIRRLLAPQPAAPHPTAPSPLLRALPPPDPTPAPATPAPSTPAATTPPPLPTEPVRSQWERIVLAPDVELHVRRPLTRTQTRRVDRLVTIGRELLEEDPT